MFFEHPDELHSLRYATLLTVASIGHQTAELQANILVVSAYDTQATGHELHESRNGRHYYLLTDFLHGCVAGILLALVHSTEPTRFNS